MSNCSCSSCSRTPHPGAAQQIGRVRPAARRRAAPRGRRSGSPEWPAAAERRGRRRRVSSSMRPGRAGQAGTCHGPVGRRMSQSTSSTRKPVVRQGDREVGRRERLALARRGAGHDQGLERLAAIRPDQAGAQVPEGLDADGEGLVARHGRAGRLLGGLRPPSRAAGGSGTAPLRDAAGDARDHREPRHVQHGLEVLRPAHGRVERLEQVGHHQSQQRARGTARARASAPTLSARGVDGSGGQVDDVDVAGLDRLRHAGLLEVLPHVVAHAGQRVHPAGRAASPPPPSRGGSAMDAPLWRRRAPSDSTSGVDRVRSWLLHRVHQLLLGGVRVSARSWMRSGLSGRGPPGPGGHRVEPVLVLEQLLVDARRWRVVGHGGRGGQGAERLVARGLVARLELLRAASRTSAGRRRARRCWASSWI